MKFESPQFESFGGKDKGKENNPDAENNKKTLLAFAAQKAFDENDLSATLERLRELQGVAGIEQKGDLEFKEARELFGKDFIGAEAAEKTWGVKLKAEELKAIEKIPFTKAELEKAKQLGMMLVLRVSHDKEDKPLTMNRMREVLDGEDKLGDSKKKKSQMFASKKGTGWYNKEEFADKAVAKLGWGLAMKTLLAESRSKNWDEQEKILQDWAKKNAMDPKTVRRRTPVETAYDTLSYYEANKESLLEDGYDWSSVRSSDGDMVCVGGVGSDGLDVFYAVRSYSTSDLGVCPSR